MSPARALTGLPLNSNVSVSCGFAHVASSGKKDSCTSLVRVFLPRLEPLAATRTVEPPLLLHSGLVDLGVSVLRPV